MPEQVITLLTTDGFVTLPSWSPFEVRLPPKYLFRLPRLTVADVPPGRMHLAECFGLLVRRCSPDYVESRFHCPLQRSRGYV